MSIISRLRRTRPYLTPGYGDEIPPFDVPHGRPVLSERPIVPPDVVGSLGLPERVEREDAPMPRFGAPPSMVLARRGRPVTVAAEGSDLDRAVIRRRALEEYQPKEESWKHLLLRGALQFPFRGLMGTGATIASGALDRKGLDRGWKEQELERADESIGRLRADRRTELQDKLLESQVAEKEAQAIRARREPIDKDRVVGGNVIRRNPQGGYETVYSGTKPEAPVDRVVGNRILRRTPEGYQTVYEGDEKPATTPEQIRSAIAEMEAEKKSLGEPPPTEIPDINEFGEVVGKKVNPAYLHWAKRYRELDDKIRELKLKPASPQTSAKGSRTWSASKWAAANPKGDVEAAKKAATAKGYRVVE